MSYITTFRGCFHFDKQPSNKLIKKINDFSKENHEDINCSASMCHWIVCKDSKYRRYKSLDTYYHLSESAVIDNIAIADNTIDLPEAFKHQQVYLNQEYNENITEENQLYVLKWDEKKNEFKDWYFWLRYISEQFLSKENIHLTGLIEYQSQDGLIIGVKKKYINCYEDIYYTIKQYFSKDVNENISIDKDNEDSAVSESNEDFDIEVNVTDLIWLKEDEIKKRWEENKEFFCDGLSKMFKKKYEDYSYVDNDIFENVEKLCALIRIYKRDESVWNAVSYCVSKEFEEFIGEPSYVWQKMWENEISRKWLKFIWCLDNNEEWVFNDYKGNNINKGNIKFEVDEFESTYEELGIEIDLDGCNSECDIMYNGKCELKDDIIEALRKRYRGKCGYIALDNWMRVSNESENEDKEDWNKSDYINDEGSCVIWGSRDKR